MAIRILPTIVLLATVSFAGYDPLSIGGDWLINGYKAVLSPLQGPNMCNFEPTCSQFTKAAIRGAGLFTGILVGGDRLMRCNPFAWSYYDEYYVGTSGGRILDPVTNHVAWRQPPPAAGIDISGHPAESLRVRAEAFEPSLSFAEQLFGNEEYRQSAAEYLRVRFASSQTGVRDYAGLMAGEAFFMAHDFDRSRLAFADVRSPRTADLCLYGAGRSLFAQARYPDARNALDSVSSERLRFDARVLSGWSYFKQYRFEDGAARFAGLPGDTRASELSTMDGRRIHRRNRLVSSLLSAVLPGAGQVYSGRAGDGAYSLLAVAGTSLAAYWFAADPEQRDRTHVKVSIFGAVTALFYAANVYGANIAARDYNSAQERRYLERIDALLSQTRLNPDYRPLLAADSLPSEPPPGR